MGWQCYQVQDIEHIQIRNRSQSTEITLLFLECHCLFQAWKIVLHFDEQSADQKLCASWWECVIQSRMCTMCWAIVEELACHHVCLREIVIQNFVSWWDSIANIELLFCEAVLGSLTWLSLSAYIVAWNSHGASMYSNLCHRTQIVGRYVVSCVPAVWITMHFVFPFTVPEHSQMSEQRSESIYLFI